MSSAALLATVVLSGLAAAPLDVDPTTLPGSSFFADGGDDAVTEPLAIEALLAEECVDASRAVLLAVDPPDADGAGRVRRLRVADGAVLASATLAPRGACAPLPDDGWSGANLRAVPRGPDDADRGAPSLVLLDGSGAVDSFVLLDPGDSVEARAVARGGRTVLETLSVRHDGAVLELRRSRERSSVCLVPAASTSPAERP